MRKLKSFKDIKSMRKREYVKITEDIFIPVKSLNLYDEIKSEDLGIEPPVKEVKCTEEEVKEFAENNPGVNKMYLKNLKKKVLDYSDKEYQKKKEDKTIEITLNKVVKHIDLKHEVENSDEKLWENIGLESAEDIEGLKDFLFNKLELGTTFFTKLRNAVEAVKGDPAATKLNKLENVFGEDMDITEMVTHMVDFMENKDKFDEWLKENKKKE